MLLKKKNTHLIITFIIILFILFIFILFLFVNKRSNENFSNENFSNENFSNEILNSYSDDTINKNYTYYRCNDKVLGKITQDIFNFNNINQSNENWDIYVPCGYNNVEEELKKIKVNNNKNNKYIFGINGCDSIVSKNKIWESLVNCYGRKHASKLMPESYVLNNPDDMITFKNYFNEFDGNIYILKKNVQRKEGLKLTREYNEIIKGSKDNYRVVQKYITDLYLINQRKINLRIYLLIVIKDNNVNFYLCRKGKCIYTNKKYNDNDFDFESNITSYNLDMSVYKDSPRYFNELERYIFQNGNNGKFLFDQIEKLMKQISICLSHNLYQSKNIKDTISFQLFGCDVIFDDELHPYLLEINKGPDMTPRDEEDEFMKNTVQNDMFKTVGIIPHDNDNNSFYIVYKKTIEYK